MHLFSPLDYNLLTDLIYLYLSELPCTQSLNSIVALELIHDSGDLSFRLCFVTYQPCDLDRLFNLSALKKIKIHSGFPFDKYLLIYSICLGIVLGAGDMLLNKYIKMYGYMEFRYEEN